MIWTKEERSIYMKSYRQANKERIKDYRQEIRYKTIEQQKEYRKSEQGKKHRTIGIWKYNGLIGDYDQIYERYVNTHKCDVCLKDFKDSFDRCMDHDHETGLFRQILCRSCNNHDGWKKFISFSNC